MLEALTNLVPRPIKDVVMAPLAAKENPNLAADRLIRSSIRIAIAAIGVFSKYELCKTFASSLPGAAAGFFLPIAVVYIASIPAGNIMYGFEFLSFGAVGLITALGLEALTLFSLSLKLLMSGICIGCMSVGLLCIHTGDEGTSWGEFSGYLEPYITNIAQKYQDSVAGFLSSFYR